MIEHGAIRVFGERIVDHIKFFPGRFALGVFFHGHEMPGHVREHRVSLIAGFHAGCREKTLRHAVELGFGEDDRRFRVHDVAVEIGAELGQLLAQIFDFFAFLRGQRQTRAAIIAHGFVEELFVFAGEIRFGVGKRFERFINVFAVIDADRPILKFLYRVFGRRAHLLVGVAFFDHDRLVRGIAGLITEIIERDDRALEGDFA